ncbi:MAG: tail fiber domain-containing protein, partial [Bacteroidia bacterium]|nr:tail fiber domain-containing protein [Bacteroidia bacterium]
NLAGSVEKLAVAGTTSALDEALFEVKNKNGQTIFAVYNEGVRIYVDDGAKGTKGGFAVGGFDMTKATKREYLVVSDDSIRMYLDSNPLTKGTKGGFAVGGFDMTKGTIQNYLDVSDDSIRLYIDNTGKGTKGGFAVGGFDMTKGIKGNFLNISTDATGVINPAQNRILWYPLKNAFLAGRVLITSSTNVGENSFAVGYEPKAKGMYSQAMGFKPIALGNYSTAMGKNATANFNNSFALGDGAVANNIDSYAFGAGAQTVGSGSFAFGSFGRDTLTGVPNTQPTYASGNYAFAIGLGAVASGQSSTALGINSASSGDASMALGVFSKAQGSKSVALMAGQAIGMYSFAAGFMSRAGGDYSIAIGRGITKFGGVYNDAAGYESIALGYSRAYGPYSIAIGTATVNGTNGTGIGNSVTVNGGYATAIGTLLTADSYRSFVIGNNNIVSGSTTAWNPTDPLFVIGNGVSTPSNAMTVLKNGKVGIGTSTPTHLLDLRGELRITQSTSYDVWIQGGSVTSGDDRNLAIVGSDEDSGDKLMINYGSEYAAGTEIQSALNVTGALSAASTLSVTGAVTAASTLSVTGALTFSDPYTRTITSPRYLYVNASGAVGGISSSIKYKENINKLEDIDWLFDLKPVTYNYKNSDPTDIYYGLIAEEVSDVNPLLVIYGPDKKPDGLMYEKLTIPLLKAIQDQKKEIDTLKETINKLETLVNKLLEEK